MWRDADQRLGDEQHPYPPQAKSVGTVRDVPEVSADRVEGGTLEVETRKMRVMGVDPGIRNCGVVVLEKKNGGKVEVLFSKTIVTKSDDCVRKLVQLGDAVFDVAVEFVPHEVVVEDVLWYGRKKGMLDLAKAVGVVLRVCQGLKPRLVPAHLKKLVPVPKGKVFKGWTEHARDAYQLAMLRVTRKKNAGRA